MTKPTMLLIAGFGDDASMYAPLAHTPLAMEYDLVPVDLPGFGAPALYGATSLAALAEAVADRAAKVNARVIVAHSVASVIASLAARKVDCPIETIVSLEGNITAEDAYFSGTAADFDDADTFRLAFLERLAVMAASDPVIARYRERVLKADPLALWQLGCDARHFSNTHVPGEVLQDAARVIYFYNPDNCPDSTISWLEQAGFEPTLLPGASHWPTIDQPEQLAKKMLAALR